MTNLSADFSRPDPVPETPTLEDVLRMVSLLAQHKRLGREWRRLALALTNAAEDLDKVSGLVVEGEVYDASWQQDYAPCGCRQGHHPFTRDSPWFGRGHWTETRADAQAITTKIKGHLLTHLVATTPMEVVR